MSTDLATLRATHVDLLEKELARITAELERLDARLVVLFGSYAHGRRDLFTDLDLLVVMESDEPFVGRIASLYARLHPKVAADILVYTPEEFEEMKLRRFVRHALKTGRVLYARE
jgi:predicted nucleotidyltransferase